MSKSVPITHDFSPDQSEGSPDQLTRFPGPFTRFPRSITRFPSPITRFLRSQTNHQVPQTNHKVHQVPQTNHQYWLYISLLLLILVSTLESLLKILTEYATNLRVLNLANAAYLRGWYLIKHYKVIKVFKRCILYKVLKTLILFPSPSSFISLLNQRPTFVC